MVYDKFEHVLMSLHMTDLVSFSPKIYSYSYQQLDDLRLELNRSHELRKSLESCIVEMSKELDDLKLQLSHSQGKQKELESRLEKMPFLRDYAYQQDLQIDLLKVRIESLENRQI